MTFSKEQQKIALTLFVVALVAASMLAWVASVTKGPIAEAQRATLHKNIKQVLPEHSNDPVKDMFVYPLSAEQDVQVFPAKDKKGDVLAYAWEQIAPDGYSGTIRILLGVRLTGEVVAIRITSHKETPGLGDGITKDLAWLGSFIDKTLSNTKWSVKKDGGNFDQFTGATITPRAVVKAVQQGLLFYKNSQADLLKRVYITPQAKNVMQEGAK
ncbi:RnfABCDGE type electron transport complex subunit G [Mariprofundus ferrooxydans]|nr:RnfABCDGE type electron transport complex subunit G [Mariprofundus ferrooxydans]